MDKTNPTKDRDYCITFIHTDEKEYTFSTAFNKLNGNWMFTWDNWGGCFVADSKYEINTIIRNIRKKCKIIKENNHDNNN